MTKFNYTSETLAPAGEFRARTDIFPSASLRLNKELIFDYKQPSYLDTHGGYQGTPDYQLIFRK